MRFEVVGDDGRRAEVDTADWMMALVRGVDKLGDRVSGFSCSTGTDGVVTVEDHGSGRIWRVRSLGAGGAVERRKTPAPSDVPATLGPTPNRLMQPTRRMWRANAPRPLWAPDATPRPDRVPVDPRRAPPKNLGETLFEHAQGIQKCATIDAAMELALQRALVLVPAEGGSVLRGGRDDQELEFVAVRGGAGDSLLGRTVAWGEGIAGAVAVGGVPLVVRDAGSDPRHHSATDRATGFKTGGIMAVPVRSDTGFYGVIELVNPTLGDAFLPWHVDVVESLAQALANRLSGRT